MRKVVILAAGSGRRLLPITARIPKPLLKFGSETLLEYQVRILTQQRISPRDVIVVTGHLRDTVENVVSELNCDAIFNSRYQDTNNVVSLFYSMEWAARQKDLWTEIVIVNADTLAHPEIFRSLLQAPVENAAVVDRSRSQVEEAMKVRIERGAIAKFSKSLLRERSDGEYIGLARFAGEGLAALSATLKEMVQRGEVNEWYEEAFNDIAEDISIHPVFTQGLPWVEIDTPEDYRRAQMVYEEISQ